MKLEPTERVNLTLSAGAVAASFALASPVFAASLAAGAALEVVNFRALHRTARALFGGELAGGSPWVVLLALRFVVLTVAIGLAIGVGAHPLGLVLGLSLVVPASIAAALLNRPDLQPADPAPALDPDDPSWDTYSIWRFREVEPREEDDQ
ncbi:MAG: hypothetical protein ACQGVK_13690 [Myxococcota bacterium]